MPLVGGGRGCGATAHAVLVRPRSRLFQYIVCPSFQPRSSRVFDAADSNTRGCRKALRLPARPRPPRRSSIPPAKFPVPRAGGDRRAHVRPGRGPTSSWPARRSSDGWGPSASSRNSCAHSPFRGADKAQRLRPGRIACGGETAVEGYGLRAAASSMTEKLTASVPATGCGESVHSRERRRQPRSGPARCFFRAMEQAIGGFAGRRLMRLRLSFTAGRLKLSTSVHAPGAVLRVPGGVSRVARLGCRFC